MYVNNGELLFASSFPNKKNPRQDQNMGLTPSNDVCFVFTNCSIIFSFPHSIIVFP